MSKIKEYLLAVDKVIAEGKFKDDWQSLAQFSMPSWYKQGRFGLFIHWGAYSVPATESEWYPRLMYRMGSKSYFHRIKTYGAKADYLDIVKLFKPDKFDASEWVRIFKDSGARYIMPVGEHHDGIKMYGSELSQWNMVELNQRNYMQELHDACDEQEIGFLMSNHRAEHYWFLNTARKHCPDSAVAMNKIPDLYGAAFLPPSGNCDRTDKEIHATTEWLEDWLASACEMIDLNRPLAVYFDWWIHKREFKPYLKKFLAYYYNRGDQWGKEVGVFYKWGAMMPGTGIFDVERGQVNGVQSSVWQNDTAIAKNSWGYTEGNQFKSAKDIARNMIEVVSKNGAYMLNVGPKADGTICQEERDVLSKIGAWLKVNGEAIYDSEPFEVTDFEGKKTANGAFKENKKYRKNEFCFTARSGAIYVFPMWDKIGSKLAIKSLRFANEHGIRYDIKSVKLLGDARELDYTQTESVMTIELGANIEPSMPICIKVVID